jgi:NAD(P)-dependent dehydrogenase (short-subunit alcohol dehydrogenase family)
MRNAAVVTGANRGIGLELARQLAERGATVIGTARDPEAAAELRGLGVRVERLDLADGSSIADFAKRLKTIPVDLLVNNAAIGDASTPAERVPAAQLEEYFRVNALGPFLLTQALLPNLRAGDRKLAVAISSGLGSIGPNRDGGWVGYRASKAALHQLFRTLAAELSREGLIFVLLSPGWVRTRMGGQEAPLSPEQSVRAILKVLDRLSKKDTGKFFDHRGKELPW